MRILFLLTVLTFSSMTFAQGDPKIFGYNLGGKIYPFCYPFQLTFDENEALQQKEYALNVCRYYGYTKTLQIETGGLFRLTADCVFIGSDGKAERVVRTDTVKKLICDN